MYHFPVPYLKQGPSLRQGQPRDPQRPRRRNAGRAGADPGNAGGVAADY